jgi:hypothetical protein
MAIFATCPHCLTGPTHPLVNYDARRCECGRRIWTGYELAEARPRRRRRPVADFEHEDR